MIVYDLRTFAKTLRVRLLAARTLDEVRDVANIIVNAKHEDGSLLTMQEQNKVIYYIKYNPVNDSSNSILLQETDNSEFLKLVAMVSDIIKGEKH